MSDESSKQKKIKPLHQNSQSRLYEPISDRK